MDSDQTWNGAIVEEQQQQQHQRISFKIPGTNHTQIQQIQQQNQSQQQQVENEVGEDLRYTNDYASSPSASFLASKSVPITNNNSHIILQQTQQQTQQQQNQAQNHQMMMIQEQLHFNQQEERKLLNSVLSDLKRNEFTENPNANNTIEDEQNFSDHVWSILFNQNQSSTMIQSNAHSTTSVPLVDDHKNANNSSSVLSSLDSIDRRKTQILALELVQILQSQIQVRSRLLEKFDKAFDIQSLFQQFSSDQQNQQQQMHHFSNNNNSSPLKQSFSRSNSGRHLLSQNALFSSKNKTFAQKSTFNNNNNGVINQHQHHHHHHHNNNQNLIDRHLVDDDVSNELDRLERVASEENLLTAVSSPSDGSHIHGIVGGGTHSTTSTSSFMSNDSDVSMINNSMDEDNSMMIHNLPHQARSITPQPPPHQQHQHQQQQIQPQIPTVPLPKPKGRPGRKAKNPQLILQREQQAAAAAAAQAQAQAKLLTQQQQQPIQQQQQPVVVVNSAPVIVSSVEAIPTPKQKLQNGNHSYYDQNLSSSAAITKTESIEMTTTTNTTTNINTTTSTKPTKQNTPHKQNGANNNNNNNSSDSDLSSDDDDQEHFFDDLEEYVDPNSGLQIKGGMNGTTRKGRDRRHSGRKRRQKVIFDPADEDQTVTQVLTKKQKTGKELSPPLTLNGKLTYSQQQQLLIQQQTKLLQNSQNGMLPNGLQSPTRNGEEQTQTQQPQNPQQQNSQQPNQPQTSTSTTQAPNPLSQLLFIPKTPGKPGRKSNKEKQAIAAALAAAAAALQQQEQSMKNGHHSNHSTTMEYAPIAQAQPYSIPEQDISMMNGHSSSSVVASIVDQQNENDETNNNENHHANHFHSPQPETHQPDQDDLVDDVFSFNHDLETTTTSSHHHPTTISSSSILLNSSAALTQTTSHSSIMDMDVLETEQTNVSTNNNTISETTTTTPPLDSGSVTGSASWDLPTDPLQLKTMLLDELKGILRSFKANGTLAMTAQQVAAELLQTEFGKKWAKQKSNPSWTVSSFMLMEFKGGRGCFIRVGKAEHDGKGPAQNLWALNEELNMEKLKVWVKTRPHFSITWGVTNTQTQTTTGESPKRDRKAVIWE